MGLLLVSFQSKHPNSLFRYRSKTTKTNCFETNRKKPKKKRKNPTFSVKIANYASYQTVSVGLLFVLGQSKKFWFVSFFFGVSNLYRNNRNKQNCFVTNQNYPKFFEKYPNILSFKLFGWVFCQTVSVGLLFVSVQSKHRNSLLQYRRETTKTKVLFPIVPKLVLVPFSVVLNRN